MCDHFLENPALKLVLEFRIGKVRLSEEEFCTKVVAAATKTFGCDFEEIGTHGKKARVSTFISL